MTFSDIQSSDKRMDHCIVINFATPNEFANFSKLSNFPKCDRNKTFLGFCLVYIPRLVTLSCNKKCCYIIPAQVYESRQVVLCYRTWMKKSSRTIRTLISSAKLFRWTTRSNTYRGSIKREKC